MNSYDIINLSKKTEQFLESEFVQETWTKQERAGGWQLLCFIVQEMKIKF
jgi:hypothetical protein